MNSCRESIVNNESIKENTGGRPGSLVSCRYGYGILGKMSISSETASALMFCHVEKLERNVVVCEQMASPQLL